MSGEVLCPDLGDFKDVPIIDVLIKPGDMVEVDTPLVTLETDKATMDVPSSAAGRVAEVLVQKGGRVSKGTPLVRLESAASAGWARHRSCAGQGPGPSKALQLLPRQRSLP